MGVGHQKTRYASFQSLYSILFLQGSVATQ